MSGEKVIAGTEVAPGVYRCNACANHLETKEDKEKLPACSICDSVSWRVYRFASKPKDGQA